jgi:sugar O-acyltransferase (sialic acid O-acetyltransferase NeuD family)
MPDSIVMLGGGGHALVVAEAAALAGFRVVGLYDDHPDPVAARLLHIPRLGNLDAFLASRETTPAILAFGDLAFRCDLLGRLHARANHFARALVHPSAVVHASATLGRGVYIGPTAVVHSFAVISDHAIINTAAVVEHECRIGTNAHLAPGAILGGRVTIGDGTLVGLGSRILPNLSVGNSAIVGAGAIVTRDVAPGLTVVGSPARDRALTAPVPPNFRPSPHSSLGAKAAI